MEELKLSDLPLTVPPDLSGLANLRSLTMYRQKLMTLPPVLKGNVRLASLSFYGCDSLQALPDLRECPALKFLAFDSSIATTPDLEPCSVLEDLWMNCEGMPSPPDISPCLSTLDALSLIGVVTRLPEAIIRLPRRVTVLQFRTSPFATPQLGKLAAIVQSPGYDGHPLEFRVEELLLFKDYHHKPHPLNQEVASWMTSMSKQEAQRWTELANAPEASFFTGLLCSLRDIRALLPQPTMPAFTMRVQHLLQQMHAPENDSLREKCFLAAKRVIPVNPYNVALALLHMEELIAANDAQKHLAVPGKEVELIELGKGMFRLAQIKALAAEDAKKTLSYIAELSTEQELPVHTDMLRPTFPTVTPDELHKARKQLHDPPAR